MCCARINLSMFQNRIILPTIVLTLPAVIGIGLHRIRKTLIIIGLYYKIILTYQGF